MVVLLTVRLAISLKEVSRADLVLTVGAHKVLRVPRAAHSRHHLVKTRTTFRSTVVREGVQCTNLYTQNRTAIFVFMWGLQLESQFYISKDLEIQL